MLGSLGVPVGRQLVVLTTQRFPGELRERAVVDSIAWARAFSAASSPVSIGNQNQALILN
jgi:hypothetical protein